MEALKVPLYTRDGKQTGTLELDTAVFDGEVNAAAVYQTVTAYLANQRRGLASTKTMGEVSGGGRKPWRQKGTGRARVGSIRSPLWYHGGVVFGPHPRDFSCTVPAKIRAVALRSALSAKAKEENFIVLEDFSLAQPKAKEAAMVFTRLKIDTGKKSSHKTLFLFDALEENAKRGVRNLDFIRCTPAAQTNAYEVLAARKLVITRAGLAALTERLKKQ